jgi:hypothetical protein
MDYRCDDHPVSKLKDGEDQMGSGKLSALPASAVEEIDILWITAGLGCDGDTIAMTAATQPSIEDVIGGALPWIPKVRLLNPFSPSRTEMIS